MDFELLKSLATEHGEQTLAWLAEVVPVPCGTIPRRDIKIVLLGLGKIDSVAAAVPLFFNDPDFSSINVADPLTQGVLAQLVTGNVLTAEDKAAVDALGTKEGPRWQSLGFDREPDFADIERANAL